MNADRPSPGPQRPDPFIVEFSGFGGRYMPVCRVCGGFFHGDEWDERVRVRWFGRKWAHRGCA